MILLQFLFFLGQTDSTAGQQESRKKRDSPARNNTKEAPARPSSVAAKSVRRQAIHRRIPQATPPGSYRACRRTGIRPSLDGECVRRGTGPAVARCPQTGSPPRSDREWAGPAVVPAQGRG